MTKKQQTQLMIAAGIGLIGYMSMRKAGQAVTRAGQLINPVDHDNIFHQGANRLGQVVTGNDGFQMSDIFCNIFGDCEPTGYTGGYGNHWTGVTGEQLEMLKEQDLEWD